MDNTTTTTNTTAGVRHNTKIVAPPPPVLPASLAKQRAKVVPVRPIPDSDGPNQDFLQQIQTLHSLLAADTSLAIATGHEDLLDRPLHAFPSLLAMKQMTTLQAAEYTTWTSSNCTYVPRSVQHYRQLHPISGADTSSSPAQIPPTQGGNNPPREALSNTASSTNAHLTAPLRYIFNAAPGEILPETIAWTMNQGRRDLLPLAQAILKVLNQKDKIGRLVRRRGDGDKWPTAEELAELVVAGKIVRAIQDKVTRIIEGSGARAHNWKTCRECRGLVTRLRALQKDFEGREAMIWRGEWIVRGYKTQGEVEGTW